MIFYNKIRERKVRLPFLSAFISKLLESKFQVTWGAIFKTKITLMIFVKKFKNLCLNSSSECLLSKTLRSRLRTPFRSKVIVEMVTKGHISTLFLSDYVS